MNFAADAQLIVGFLEKAAASEGEVASVLSFIHGAIATAEQLGIPGTDKMTKVLNSVEAWVNKALNLVVDIQPFLLTVEKFVNTVVSIFNEVGIFVHKVFK